MPETIHPTNPRVFVCRLGHVSKEANGYVHRDTLRCKKLVKGEPCRKSAIIMDGATAKSLYTRGYRSGRERVHNLAQRAYDALMINIRDWQRDLRDAL